MAEFKSSMCEVLKLAKFINTLKSQKLHFVLMETNTYQSSWDKNHNSRALKLLINKCF